MDFSVRYCPERRILEQRSWKLVSRFAVLTDKLFMLVGGSHLQFIAMLDTCHDVEGEITDSRERLREHREAHGC
jgi:tRNA A37 N6-isopentenylltransferase MiaA